MRVAWRVVEGFLRRCCCLEGERRSLSDVSDSVVQRLVRVRCSSCLIAAWEDFLNQDAALGPEERVHLDCCCGGEGWRSSHQRGMPLIPILARPSSSGITCLYLQPCCRKSHSPFLIQWVQYTFLDSSDSMPEGGRGRWIGKLTLAPVNGLA